MGWADLTWCGIFCFLSLHCVQEHGHSYALSDLIQSENLGARVKKCAFREFPGCCEQQDEGLLGGPLGKTLVLLSESYF